MLRLKKQYEVVIEGRNYTGIMLIDRNDELCILHEKHNIQVWGGGVRRWSGAFAGGGGIVIKRHS